MQAKKKVQTKPSAAKPSAAKPAAPKATAAKPVAKPVAPAKKVAAKPQAPAPKAAAIKSALVVKPAAAKPVAIKPVPAKPSAGVEVVFERYSPQSHSVDLVGTFNDWTLGKNPLRRDKAGRWSTTLKLKPGSYEYKFVYDGLHYEPDPERELVTNSFGSANNLLIVA